MSSSRSSTNQSTVISGSGCVRKNSFRPGRRTGTASVTFSTAMLSSDADRSRGISKGSQFSWGFSVGPEPFGENLPTGISGAGGKFDTENFSFRGGRVKRAGDVAPEAHQRGEY